MFSAYVGLEDEEVISAPNIVTFLASVQLPKLKLLFLSKQIS